MKKAILGAAIVIVALAAVFIGNAVQADPVPSETPRNNISHVLEFSYTVGE